MRLCTTVCVGPDIRSKRKPTPEEKPAHIFYSTKDLASYFTLGEATRCPKLIAKKFGFELDILERRYHWTEIPDIPSNYNCYLDIKEDQLTHEALKAEYSSSLAELQALSIELKIIDANERTYDKFPEEND